MLSLAESESPLTPLRAHTLPESVVSLVDLDSIIHLSRKQPTHTCI
ncbi:hypothetical protein [uncultured Helicobacter sp.]